MKRTTPPPGPVLLRDGMKGVQRGKKKTTHQWRLHPRGQKIDPWRRLHLVKIQFYFQDEGAGWGAHTTEHGKVTRFQTHTTLSFAFCGSLTVRWVTCWHWSMRNKPGMESHKVQPLGPVCRVVVTTRWAWSCREGMCFCTLRIMCSSKIPARI